MKSSPFPFLSPLYAVSFSLQCKSATLANSELSRRSASGVSLLSLSPRFVIAGLLGEGGDAWDGRSFLLGSGPYCCAPTTHGRTLSENRFGSHHHPTKSLFWSSTSPNSFLLLLLLPTDKTYSALERERERREEEQWVNAASINRVARVCVCVIPQTKDHDSFSAGSKRDNECDIYLRLAFFCFIFEVFFFRLWGSCWNFYLRWRLNRKFKRQVQELTSAFFVWCWQSIKKKKNSFEEDEEEK